MRSAILGAYFADEPQKRRDFVLASSRLTHRGWQAETAALAVAECAALTVLADGAPATSLVLSNLASHPRAKMVAQIVVGNRIGAGEWRFCFRLCSQAWNEEWRFRVCVACRACRALCLDASPRRVPDGAYFRAGVWGRHRHSWRDFRALAGAVTGKSEIPADWLVHIWEWPRSCGFWSGSRNVWRRRKPLADVLGSPDISGPA